MNDKPNDIIYFDIDKKSPILNSEEMQLYFYYVLSRHNIQILKESGCKFPWTDNLILRDNSFTCNRRVDDRTTKWLLSNISNNPNIPLNERFWRSIIFRLYNKIETAEIIHLDSASFDEMYDKYSYILDQQNGDVYTRAYKTVGTKYIDKEKYSDHSWKSLSLLRIIDLAKTYNYQIPEDCLKTAKIAFDWITSTIKGAGSFIGMQILIDLMYINEIPYSNNYFVVAGPGAQVGLDRIFSDKDRMSYEECLVYIQKNFEELCQKYYLDSFDYTNIKNALDDNQAYCITDIQNTFCEFSKFRYLMENRHKNKRRYIPNHDCC